MKIRSKRKSIYFQFGKIGVPIVVIILALGLLLLLWVKPNPQWSEQSPVVTNPYCGLDSGANAPEIQAYNYVIRQDGCPGDPGGDCSETIVLDGTDRRYPNAQTATFKRIKSNVPIWGRYFGDPWVNQNGDTIDQDIDVHFFTGSNFQTTPDGKIVYYPSPENGKSKIFRDRDSNPEYIELAPLGLLFVRGQKITIPELKEYKLNGRYETFDNAEAYVTDIYQRVGAPPIPDYALLDCVQEEIAAGQTITPGVTLVQPTQQKSRDENQLQLEYVLFNKENPEITTLGWWTPECKPAIYLYPKEKTDVHVQVFPKGYLTYTDPLYPKEGWSVSASPDGTISSNGREYPYLYYESKIKDEFIQKPEKGYVVSFGDLESTFNSLLPKLGLNAKETQEFKEYWLKVLPFSPYYFVGVMSEETIDQIEPLKILPTPDTMVRVRLYFEARPSWEMVEPPAFKEAKRNGFTVIEWGGMVKLHPGEEFTCSQ